MNWLYEMATETNDFLPKGSSSVIRLLLLEKERSVPELSQIRDDLPFRIFVFRVSKDVQFLLLVIIIKKYVEIYLLCM